MRVELLNYNKAPSLWSLTCESDKAAVASSLKRAADAMLLPGAPQHPQKTPSATVPHFHRRYLCAWENYRCVERYFEFLDFGEAKGRDRRLLHWLAAVAETSPP